MRRLYVLISKKLDPVYGCVQGGHAIAQHLIENGTSGWENEYLVYLYADIETWIDKLNLKGRKFTIFREPDLGNEITALAIVDDGKMFRNLKLVR